MPPEIPPGLWELAALVRKLFTDAFLDGRSKDGVTAHDGTKCDECLHRRCTAQLRVHLADGPIVYVVDLSPSAARAYLCIGRRITKAKQVRKSTCPLSAQDFPSLDSCRRRAT